MSFKKLAVTLFLSLIILFSSNAQLAKRKAFIGVSAGPDVLLGYKLGDGTKAGVGLNVNLVNFSLVITDRWGVSAVWSGAVHRFQGYWLAVDAQGNVSFPRTPWVVSYGALMVGPMYTIKLTENSSLQFKVRGGRFSAKEKIETTMVNSRNDTQTISFGYSGSITFQKMIAPRWCMNVSADYYSGKKQTIPTTFDRLSAISVNAGIDFLL